MKTTVFNCELGVMQLLSTGQSCHCVEGTPFPFGPCTLKYFPSTPGAHSLRFHIQSSMYVIYFLLMVLFVFTWNLNSYGTSDAWDFSCSGEFILRTACINPPHWIHLTSWSKWNKRKKYMRSCLFIKSTRYTSKQNTSKHTSLNVFLRYILKSV